MAKRARKNETVENQDVEQAITKLLKAHNDGKRLEKDFPKYERQSTDSEQAEKTDVWKELDLTNEDKPRKLRQFADPVAGYTEAELEALFKLCRRKNRPLGISFVYKFLTVPKENGARADFEKTAISEGWTRARIDWELKRRFGPGRERNKPRQPADEADALIRLESLCVRLRRYAAMVRQDRHTRSPKVKRAIQKLNESLDAVVEEVGKRLEKLD